MNVCEESDISAGTRHATPFHCHFLSPDTTVLDVAPIETNGTKRPISPEGTICASCESPGCGGLFLDSSKGVRSQRTKVERYLKLQILWSS